MDRFSADLSPSCLVKAAAQSAASLEQVGSEGHALSAVLSEGLSPLALQSGWLFYVDRITADV